LSVFKILISSEDSLSKFKKEIETIEFYPISKLEVKIEAID